MQRHNHKKFEKVQVWNLDGDLIEYEIRIGINFYIVLDTNDRYIGYRYNLKMFKFIKTPKWYIKFMLRKLKRLNYGKQIK